MDIKTFDGRKGKLLSETEDFVIVKLDEKEECFNKADEKILAWVHIPCDGCTTGCYNFQMGDCKESFNYEWRVLK